MDSDEEYEFDIDAEMAVEESHADRREDKGSHSPSSSENGDDYDDPPCSLLSMQWTSPVSVVRRCQ